MRFTRDEKEMLISTGRAASYLSVHVTTLQRWDREGKLRPRRLPSGHRRYSVRELDEFMRMGLHKEESAVNREEVTEGETGAVIYCRFPGLHPGTEAEVESRVGSLAGKAESMGLCVRKVITDVGSGVDEDRGGLNELLNYISENPGTCVVVKSKNQLATVGWNFLKRFLDTQGCRIVETDSAPGSSEKELLYDDIMNLADRLRNMVAGRPGNSRRCEVSAGIESLAGTRMENTEETVDMP